MPKASFDLEPIHERANEFHIFDADFHINLTAEDLLDYIDHPTIVHKIETYGGPSRLTGARGGLKSAYAKENAANPAWMHGAAITTEEIKEVMNEISADEVLLQDNTRLPLQHTRYPAIREQLVKAYNEYLVKEAIDEDEGIYGSIFVPTWDVDLALEELDKWGTIPGMVSAQNNCPGFKPPGHETLDPLYEKLTDLELPLTLHTGGASGDPANIHNEGKRTYPEKHMTAGGRAIDAAANVLGTGLFEKFTDLQIVWGELGTLWLPYAAYRFDEVYQISPEDVCLTPRMLELGKDYFDKMPSERLFENTYLTTQPIEIPFHRETAEVLLKACQAERTFLFSTDWPHSTMDLPNWVIDNPAIDAETRDKILYENAHDVYRIP